MKLQKKVSDFCVRASSLWVNIWGFLHSMKGYITVHCIPLDREWCSPLVTVEVSFPPKRKRLGLCRHTRILWWIKLTHPQHKLCPEIYYRVTAGSFFPQWSIWVGNDNLHESNAETSEFSTAVAFMENSPRQLHCARNLARREIRQLKYIFTWTHADGGKCLFTFMPWAKSVNCPISRPKYGSGGARAVIPKKNRKRSSKEDQ